MAGELRSIGRHTLVYGIGTAVGKLASFLMLPVYTRYLTPADYGVLELMGTTIDVVAMIAGLGLAGALFKEYAAIDDPAERARMISTVTLASGALSAVAAVAGIAAAPLLAGRVLDGAAPALWLQLFFVIYFLQSLSGIPFMLMRAEDRSLLFVWLNVARLVGTLALNILFVVHLEMGVPGVILGNVIASGVMGAALTAWTFRRVGFAFSLPLARRLGRFGSPLVVWSLASFVLVFSDRYFLVHYAGAAEVGIYSLACRFGFLLSAFAVAPLSQVWEPRRFVVARQADAQAVFRRVFLWQNVALGFCGAGIVLLVGDVLALMASPAFAPAARVVPLIVAATVLQQWTGFCNLGLFLTDRTRTYAWTGIVGVVVALALNAALIPRWGMWGAAWATVGAFAVRFAAVYAMAQRAYPIGYGWERTAALAAVFSAVVALRALSPLAPGLASAALSMGLLALSAAAVYALVLGEEDRAAVRGILRRRTVGLAAGTA
jgi:O-antigen/teichoic acid export membrane protein